MLLLSSAHKKMTTQDKAWHWDKTVTLALLTDQCTEGRQDKPPFDMHDP